MDSNLLVFWLSVVKLESRQLWYKTVCMCLFVYYDRRPNIHSGIHTCQIHAVPCYAMPCIFTYRAFYYFHSVLARLLMHTIFCQHLSDMFIEHTRRLSRCGCCCCCWFIHIFFSFYFRLYTLILSHGVFHSIEMIASGISVRFVNGILLSS